MVGWWRDKYKQMDNLGIDHRETILLAQWYKRRNFSLLEVVIKVQTTISMKYNE
jgi:hypothetical protein